MHLTGTRGGSLSKRLKWHNKKHCQGFACLTPAPVGNYAILHWFEPMYR
jgi:hypothetical protein